MIAKEKVYKDISKNFTKGIEWEELYSIFLNAICEIPENKLLEVYQSGYIKNFCCQILVNQYYGKTSLFNRLFKKDKKRNIYKDDMTFFEINDDYDISEFISENSEYENKLSQLEILLNEEHWYDRIIFQLYTQGDKTYTELGKDLKIKKRSLTNTVLNVKNQLKNKIKNDNKTKPDDKQTPEK